MAINLDHVTEQITVTDTATNASLTVQPKGTGAFNIAAGSSGLNLSNGGTVTAITLTANGSGYTSIPSVAVSAPTTAGGVQAVLSVTSIYANTATVAAGGTGYTLNDILTVVGGTAIDPAVQFQVTGVSGGVVTTLSRTTNSRYSVLPSNPVSVTGGTGSGCTLNVTYYGPQLSITNAGSGYVEQPTVTYSGGGGSGAAAYVVIGSPTTLRSLNSVMSFYTPAGEGFRISNPGFTTLTDFVEAVGGSNVGGAYINVGGSTTNSNLYVSSKGTGSVNFFTGGGGNLRQALVSNTAGSVNYLQFTGAATGSGPTISAQGSDTNVDLNVTAKGTGNIRLNTGSGEQVRVINSGGTPTNYVALKGGAGGVTVYADGTGSAEMTLGSLGGYNLKLTTNGATNEQLRIINTNSSVNFIQMTGSATGGATFISSAGSDTNIPLSIASKGTGILYLGGGSTRISANSANALFLNAPSGAVNYVAINGSATGISPAYLARGGDANVGLTFGTYNDANIDFYASGDPNAGTGKLQVRIAPIASAVNYLQLNGSVTGGTPVISAQGSDTNIGLAFLNKGTSAFGFRNDATAGALGLELADNTTVDKTVYIDFHASASTDFDYRLSRNPGVNGNAVYQIAGTGSHVFYTGTTANQFTAVHTASAVNWVQVSGAATGGNPYVSAQGSDTNVSLTLSTKGTGGFQFAANGNSVFTGNGGTHFRVRTDLASSTGFWEVFGTTGGPILRSTATSGLIQTSGGQLSLQTDTSGTTQLAVTHTTSAVNYVQITGATTGTPVAISAQGSDSNIRMNLFSKGTESIDILTNGGAVRQARVTNTASTVNWVQMTGAVTGASPSYAVAGTDANIDLNLTTKGTGALRVITGGGEQFRVSSTASAQNYVNITGATLSNGPIISAQGAAGSIDLKLASKGYGGLLFYANETDLQFSIGLTFSPVNFFRVTGSTAGVGLVLTAQGSDTNIPVAIQPKGTGALQAQLTDSTATGGNARGANAIDFQTSRNAASQVASGSNSVVAGGSRNTASGSLTSVVGGFSNSATGYAATIVGGISHTAAGYYNFIGGGVANSGTSSTAVTSQNGTLASGSQFVTLTGSNASIKVGQYIVGAAIDTDTYVYGVGGTSLILSKPALAAGNVVLSFFTPHGVVVGGGNNTATGSYSFIGGGGDAGDSANRNVASGDWSTISGGRTNTASNLYTVISGGSSNTASGQYSSVLGGGFNQALGFGSSVAGGYANYSNGTYSQVLSGQYGSARGIDANLVMSSNAPFGGSLGVSQAAILVLGAQTVDATATVLCTNTAAAGATNQVSLPNNSAYFFTGEVVAGVTGGGNTKGWTIQGVIKRGANAASTALVGTPTVTSSYADAGASTWTIAVTADTGYGGIKVTFTGQASTTIRTVAQIRTTEMTY